MGLIARARKAAVIGEIQMLLGEEGKLRDNPALIEGNAEFFCLYVEGSSLAEGAL